MRVSSEMTFMHAYLAFLAIYLAWDSGPGLLNRQADACLFLNVYERPSYTERHALGG